MSWETFGRLLGRREPDSTPPTNPVVPSSLPPSISKQVLGIYSQAFAAWMRAKRAPSAEAARAHLQDRQRLLNEAAELVARWADGKAFEERVRNAPGGCLFPKDYL